ncbi:MAG: M23 family metallopeptidase [Prevotella sp.]
MKRFTLITTGLLLWSSTTVLAQFNTVTQTKAHRRVVPTLMQSATSAQQPSCPPHQRRDSIIATPQQTKAGQTDRLPALVSPLRHISVTSPFGYRRDPFTKKKVLHNGLDLNAYYEPAYAMMYGEVIKVGKDKRSGLYVTVRHGDFTVSYCHLSQAFVTKGTHVRPGTIIALTGNSGRSTGPHLHLTVKDTKNGRAIDPSVLLNLIKHPF